MKHIFLLFVALFMGCSLFAQPDKVYTSLQDVKNSKDVYQLKLVYKRYRKIPPVVFTFENLRSLDLSKNSIDSLPPDIANLKNLEKLNLGRNHLRTIPPEVGQLVQLKEVNFSRNPLLELPESMGNLENLEKLVLWSTGIISFPPTFVQLNSSLKFIDMRVCPMSYDDQQAIEDLLPNPRKQWDHVCNCK